MHAAKMKSVLSMPGPERYSYFVRKVADFEEVWGLFAEGRASATNAEGNAALAVWPEREFAQCCAQGDWHDCVPKALPLREFVDTIIPDIAAAGTLVVVFPTPNDVGVFVAPERLAQDLEDEERQYID